MPALRPVLLVLLALAAAPVLAAEGTSTTHTTTAVNLRWVPAALTIAPGEAVEFTLGEGMHTYEADSGSDGCPLPCTRVFTGWGKYGFHCGIHPTMRGTISVGTPPALSVASPAPGATVRGAIQVTGTATHVNESIRVVEVRVNGSLVGAAVPGADGAWSATWDTGQTANGAATLVVRALTAPTELFTDVAVPVVVANAPRVDLRAVSLAGTSAQATNATLVYQFSNNGNVPSGPFTALFEYQYKGMWRTLGAAEHPGVNDFSPGSGRFVWDTGLHVGRYTVRVTLDPDNLVAEPNESNNAAVGTAAWVSPLLPGLDPLEP